jgi:hypothetical protein
MGGGHLTSKPNVNVRAGQGDRRERNGGKKHVLTLSAVFNNRTII